MRDLLDLERFTTFALVAVLTLVCFVLGFCFPWVFLLFAFFAALTVLGIRDLRQPRHAILRNYPVLGHMRFLFEGIRPENPAISHRKRSG